MDPFAAVVFTACFIAILVCGPAWSWVKDLAHLLDRAFQATMRHLVGPPLHQLSADRLAAVEAEDAERAALDALTPLDVAVLTGLGWEPPEEVRRRTQRALEAVLADRTRPHRPPMSEYQRALAAELEEAREDQTRWRAELERERAAVRELEARLKLDQALGRFGASLVIPGDDNYETVVSADGWSRRIRTTPYLD